jgi:hypothetical protein
LTSLGLKFGFKDPKTFTSEELFKLIKAKRVTYPEIMQADPANLKDLERMMK